MLGSLQHLIMTEKCQEKSQVEGDSVDPAKGVEPRWVWGWANRPSGRAKPLKKWPIRRALGQAKDTKNGPHAVIYKIVIIFIMQPP